MIGYDVISISKTPERGMSDEDVYALALLEQAVLITRDYHFTNPIRFPVEKNIIIYIRHGNLRSEEEVGMVKKFLRAHDLEVFQGKLITLYRDSAHDLEVFQGKLITLYRDSVRIR
jgi:predicted nuclease of predicted toxin-antitoxin system